MKPDWGDYWVRAIRCNQMQQAISLEERELRDKQLLDNGLLHAPKCYDLWIIAFEKQLVTDVSQFDPLLLRALAALEPYQEGFMIKLAPKLANEGHAGLAEAILRPKVTNMSSCEHLVAWLRYAVDALHKSHSVDLDLIRKTFDFIWSKESVDHPTIFIRARYLALIGKMNDCPLNGDRGARSYFRESMQLGGSKSKIYRYWLGVELTRIHGETSLEERSVIRKIFADAIAAFENSKSSLPFRMLMADLEAKLGNLGREDDSHQSARSILWQCSAEFPKAKEVLVKWIKLEQEYGDPNFVERLRARGLSQFGERWNQRPEN